MLAPPLARADWWSEGLEVHGLLYAFADGLMEDRDEVWLGFTYHF